MFEANARFVEALRELIRPIVREIISEELETMRRTLPQPSPVLAEMPYDKLLSVKHAAEYLDTPETTIRTWLRRGQVTRYKVRGSVRVKISDIVKTK